MIKSRRMRLAGHVERTEMINAYKIWLEILKGRDHADYPEADERKMLK
jgi:hypothetical protein